MKIKKKLSSYFSIPKSRRVIYDYIRVFACIGIICLHATGDRADLTGIIFETFSRISLPLFALLSGVLILGGDKTKSYIKYYYKRFVRIVIPYLVYGIVYTGWVKEGYIIPDTITIDRLLNAVRKIPDAIVSNLREYQFFHLWYMLMIIGFYVVAPFIRKGLTAFDRNDLKWLMIVMLGAYTAADYLPLFGINIGITNFFPDWMIYFLAGYILSKIEKKSMYVVFVIAGIFSVLGMFWMKMYHGDIPVNNFYDLAPHMMLATCGFYSLMMLVEPYITRIGPVNWIIMKLSKYTFSIYMIHGEILFIYMNIHPGLNKTASGTIWEVLVVFGKCLLFAVIYDNIVTFNIQRIFVLLGKRINKLYTHLKQKVATE
jgi:Uncharacterized protein conserved in bacteria